MAEASSSAGTRRVSLVSDEASAALAPTGSSAASTPSATPAADGSSSGLWQRILNEHAPGRDTLRKDIHVLVLGSRNSGARSIVARLAGKDPADLVKGYALEYEFVPIRSKEEEDVDETVGTMHLWHFECAEFADHLNLPFTPDTAPNAMLLLIADLSNPHALMANLEKWENQLADFLLSGLYPSHPTLKASLQQRVLRDLAARQAVDKQRDATTGAKPVSGAQKAAATPTEAADGKSAAVKDPSGGAEPPSVKSLSVSSAKADDAVLTPGMLLINWGIPIIVVGTKCDQMDAVLTKHCTAVLSSTPATLKQHKQCLANFVQMHLRKWCLANGATLIYTSAHSNINCESLLNYITHRAYGFPGYVERLLTKPEAVVVPFGSDSLAELSKLPVDAVAPNGVDTSYASVFKQLPPRAELQSVPRGSAAAANTGPIVPIDHQSFLQKQLELLQRKQRDGDMFKLIPLPTSTKISVAAGAAATGLGASAGTVSTSPVTAAKDAAAVAAPKGKKVEQDAEKFFNTMLKNYKK